MDALKESKALLLALIATILLFCAPIRSYASHCVGADLSYECLGNNQYRITLNFYRDCNGISAPSSASVTIKSSSCGRNLSATLNRQGGATQVAPICPQQLNQTTCNGGNLPGIEQYVYSGVVTLPAQCADWVIGYDLCCRNSAITNLNSPGSYDMYVEARLNNANGLCDNSPVFTSLPTPYICSGQQTFYNHGAVDIDGDSLVFSLANPLGGPGSNIPFKSGLSVNNPIRVNGALTFDGNTGQLTFTPSQTQNAVLDVVVKEYRNGVLIGSTMRDIQVVVLNCNNTSPQMTGINGSNGSVPSNFNTSVCSGTPLCFDINFSDADPGQTLTATWNNGIPGATFTYTPGATMAHFCWTPTLADVGTHNFSVTLKDNACPIVGSTIKSFTVVVSPANYSLNIAKTDLSCPGGANGAATINISGGVSPTFIWSTGATTANINGLSGGIYKVTVSDQGGCSTVDSVSINEPPAIAGNLTSTNAVCNGAANGTATVHAAGGTAPGGYTYLWSVPPPNTGTTISNLAFGYYFVTITDGNGCQHRDSVFVFQPGPIVIQATASSTANYNGADISCFGKHDGEVTAVVTGGTTPYSFQWTTNANGQTNNVITGLGSGTYNVTITDANGCNAGATAIVHDPPQIAASATVNSSFNGFDISCYGANNGKATASATGGTGAYQYAWGAAAGSQATATASNLGPGQYQVTVTDANGCSISTPVTINEPPLMVLNAGVASHYNGQDITCYGAHDGRARVLVSGGTPGYTYRWNDPLHQNDFLAVDLYPTTYQVVVTDLNGCKDSAQVTLTQPTQLVANATITSNFNGVNVSCFGASDGTATGVGTGGTAPYHYNWNINGGSNTTNITGLSAGVQIILTVSDTNECNARDTIILSQPTKVVATATVTSNYNGRQITCFQANDGIAQANGNGGTPPYSYQWDANAGGVIASVAGALKAGTYSVTVTDANNCPADTNVSLVDPPKLVPSAIVTSNYNGVPIRCNGESNGALFASASGGTLGYQYQWDANAGSLTTPAATGLQAGTYTVTVTDINNCTATHVATLTQPAAVSAAASALAVTCYGFADGVTNASANGGVPGYTYQWSTSPIQSMSSATQLQAGTYTVTVADLNNCTTTTNVTVTQPDSVSLQLAESDPTCYHGPDGKTFGTASGGMGNFTYVWSTTPTQTGDTAWALLQGDYTLTVTDANGCTLAKTISVAEPQEVSVSVTPAIDSLKFGKSVVLTSDFQNTTSLYPVYSWEPAEGLSCIDCPSPTATPLVTTTYTLTFTDDHGCQASAKTTLNVDTDHPLYVPNAFSPNGDDKNDLFYVYGSGIKAIDLKIFDRWGEEVFATKDPLRGWDGVYKGTMMSPGIFVYIVKVTYVDDAERDLKGSVTLIR